MSTAFGWVTLLRSGFEDSTDRSAKNGTIRRIGYVLKLLIRGVFPSEFASALLSRNSELKLCAGR